MCPIPICGEKAEAREIRAKFAFFGHITLQRLEPVQEGVVVSPSGLRLEPLTCDWRSTLGESLLFRTDGDLCISVCCFQADMAEPPTDDINLDAGFQQMNRRGVSKYVRGNSLRLAVGTVLDYWFSVSPHEFVNTKSCQGTSLTRGENRVLAAGAGHLIQKTTQECRSLGPQRTIAPQVALPMQMHPWVWTELKIRGAKVGDLLHTRTSVVEKQQ